MPIVLVVCVSSFVNISNKILVKKLGSEKNSQVSVFFETKYFSLRLTYFFSTFFCLLTNY